MPVFQKRTDIKVFELLVRDCKYGCGEFFLRKFVCHFDAVFMPYYFRIGPRVVYRDVSISFTVSVATYSPIPSFMRRPARMISGL